LGTKQLKGKKQNFLLINSKGISHKRGRRQKKKKGKKKNSLTLSLYLLGLPHCTFSISLHTIEKQEKNQLNLIFYIFTYKHRTQKSSSSTVSWKPPLSPISFVFSLSKSKPNQNQPSTTYSRPSTFIYHHLHDKITITVVLAFLLLAHWQPLSLLKTITPTDSLTNLSSSGPITFPLTSSTIHQ
jgi:hypothetical protein